MMFHLSHEQKNRMFEGLFWGSMALGFILIIAVLVLGWQLGWQLGYRAPDERATKSVEVGLMVATVALALFTAFLWLSAAITARFARTEIYTSTAVNSANLTLQLDNRFNSDRALRIRHGAVKFLAEKRNVPIECDHEISPYVADVTDRSHLFHGLTSDLMDLFHYFDWIGYLTSPECNAIDREVLRRKLGPWILNYYAMCNAEIQFVLEEDPDRWVHLRPLYDDLINRENQWYADHHIARPKADNQEELNAFLQREHVRSHRGFNFPPKFPPN
jgi:Flp pilus assembly pilin Flp